MARPRKPLTPLPKCPNCGWELREGIDPAYTDGFEWHCCINCQYHTGFKHRKEPPVPPESPCPNCGKTLTVHIHNPMPCGTYESIWCECDNCKYHSGYQHDKLEPKLTPTPKLKNPQKVHCPRCHKSNVSDFSPDTFGCPSCTFYGYVTKSGYGYWI